MFIDKDAVLETYARYLNSAVLVIRTDGTWAVGNAGQRTDTLVSVSTLEVARIHDDSFEYTAIAVETNPANSGYTLLAESNLDGSYVAAQLSAQGRVLSVENISEEQLLAAEVKYGQDFNDNGGIGNAFVLENDGVGADLFVDGSGNFAVSTADGLPQSLKVGGVAIAKKAIAGMEVTEVVATAGGGFDVYVKSSNGQMQVANFNSDREFVSSANLSAADVTLRKAALGIDLNERHDIAVSAGWTAALGNDYLRVAVDRLTSGGTQKIDHAGAVGIVNLILAQHTSAGLGTVSASAVNDLKAIAARGNALFTSKDLNGLETDYLSSVFGKMVDGSPANSWYTGGALTKSALGNLNAGVTLDVLQKLENKWLLGKDMPMPKSQGDTANPAAGPAIGTYKVTPGEFFIDGAAVNEIRQGGIGDCYLVAALANIASTGNNAFNGMVTANSSASAPAAEKTWGIRFFDSNKQAHWVTVNSELPYDAEGSSMIGSSRTPGELWVPLFEKAYTQVNETGILPRDERIGESVYAAVEGGYADPLFSLLGKTVLSYSNNPEPFNNLITNRLVEPSDAASVITAKTEIIAALNQGKLVWLGAFDQSFDPFQNKLLVAQHAFALFDADLSNPSNSTANIYNPWGFSELPNPPANVNFISPFTLDIATLIGLPTMIFMVA